MRHEGGLPAHQLPIHGWLQRQFQTGDAALAAVFDSPNQDYVEVRLPAGVDPNHDGLTVTCFSGRVEAVWRKGVAGAYTPGVNQAGLGHAEPLSHDGSRRRRSKPPPAAPRNRGSLASWCRSASRCRRC